MKLFLFLLSIFPSFVFAGICEHKSYKCKADNQMYISYVCSGDPLLPPGAFCKASEGGDLGKCLKDNSKQTDICSKESLSSLSTNAPNNGVQSPEVARAKVMRETIGNCKYQLGPMQTKVTEIKNGACGAKKFICVFEALCTRAAIKGQCFTESGKCPADPIDCVAVRDIVAVQDGPNAIDPNLHFISDGAPKEGFR